jgi:hypothetical protein
MQSRQNKSSVNFSFEVIRNVFLSKLITQRLKAPKAAEALEIL